MGIGSNLLSDYPMQEKEGKYSNQRGNYVRLRTGVEQHTESKIPGQAFSRKKTITFTHFSCK